MDDVGHGQRAQVAQRAGERMVRRLGQAEGAPFPQPIAQRFAAAEEMRAVAIALRHDRIRGAHRAAEQRHLRALLRQRRA